MVPAPYRRRREDRDVGVLDVGVLGVQRGGDGPGRLARVLRPSNGFQRGEHDAAVRAVGEAVDRQAGEGHRVRHAGLRQGDLGHLLDHRPGTVQAGRVGQLGEGHQVPLVLLRTKPVGVLEKPKRRSAPISPP